MTLRAVRDGSRGMNQAGTQRHGDPPLERLPFAGNGIVRGNEALDIKRDGLPHILFGLFQRAALSVTTWQRRNRSDIAAFGGLLVKHGV